VDSASRRTIFLRQAALVACLAFFAAPPTASAQQKGYRPLPRYVQTAPPDQAEGDRILEQFRRIGIAGDHFLEFELRVMPRRGTERRVPGRLWGGRTAAGPIWRFVLQPGQGMAERRWLIQNGPQPALWGWSPASPERTQILGGQALFDPIAETDLTAFDLQMPFFYWTDHVFEGVTRVRGRPAQVFLLYPPADFAARHPSMSGVRVYLDLEYHAMVQAEQLGADGRVAKAMTVIDLKKVGEQWIVKSIDVRDEATRNKTRFSVTGAALELDFSNSLFDPAMLAETLAPPARIERFTP
jgi:hypothetical protein